MTLKELRQKQEELAAKAKAKYDEITDDTPAERAAEIETEFDAMLAEHDALTPRIERAERVEGLASRMQQARDQARPKGDDVDVDDVDDDEPMTYRQAFHQVILAGGMVSECSQEVRAALRTGLVDTEQFEQRAQVAGTTTAGGYTVPDEVMQQIVKTMVAWGPMYDEDVARSIVTSGGATMPIPTVNDTGRTAEPHTEGADLTDDGGKDAVFGSKELAAYTFDTEIIRWSLELAQDSMFNFEVLLGELLGERLGRIANAKLTTGTGTGMPNGIVTASTLGVTAAGAAAITGDEIIDLEHSVNRAYRRAPSCGFMFSDNVLKAVRKLKDGDGNYLWQKGDVVKGVPETYNGYRFHVNDDMADLATAQKSMLFGDFKKYFVRKVGSATLGIFREKYWPDLGIAGYVRVDGELADTTAVKHLLQA